MTDERERERALKIALEELRVGIGAPSATGGVNCEFAYDTLHDCIAVPKADYDALLADAERGNRALYGLMVCAGHDSLVFPKFGIGIWQELGFLVYKNGTPQWTEKANEFAAKMEART